jgi:hypothetical protein
MLLTIGLQERHTGWPRMGPFHAAMLLRSLSAAATQGLEERRANLEVRKHRCSFRFHFFRQWRPSHLKSCYFQAHFKHFACSEKRHLSDSCGPDLVNEERPALCWPLVAGRHGRRGPELAVEEWRGGGPAPQGLSRPRERRAAPGGQHGERSGPPFWARRPLGQLGGLI